MISRILVVDPMKRLSIPEIRSHPWFQKHLPLYIANPSPGAFNRREKASKIPWVAFRLMDMNSTVPNPELIL